MNIRSAKLEQLAQRLARLTGEDVETALERAIEERLSRVAPPAASDRRAAFLTRAKKQSPELAHHAVSAHLHRPWRAIRFKTARAKTRNAKPESRLHPTAAVPTTRSGRRAVRARKAIATDHGPAPPIRETR